MDTFPRSAGVYVITNISNGKQYVGSSINLNRRIIKHRHELNANRHPNWHLQRAWMKNGASAFTFTILEHVTDAKNLIEREQHWIDTLQPAYNLKPKAYSNLGYRRRLESNVKSSQSMMGHSVSEEARAKMRAAKLGHKQTAEQIAKRVATTRARGGYVRKPISDETRARMAAAGKGRHHTPEARAKIAAAVKQRMSTPEGRAAALVGVRHRWAQQKVKAEDGELYERL